MPTLHQTTRFIRPLLLAGCALPFLGAAEDLHIRDVRLLVGLAPEATTDQTASSPFASQSFGEADLDQDAFRGAIAFFESFGPTSGRGRFVFGLSFSHSEQESEVVPRTFTTPVEMTANPAPGSTFELKDADFHGPIELRINTVDLHLGYALLLTPRLHVEFVPFLGGGGARMQEVNDTTTGGTADFSSNGDSGYFEYGVRGGIYWTFRNGAQIGLDAGFLQGHSDVSFSDDFVYTDHKNTASTLDDEEREIHVTVENDVEVSGIFVNLGLGMRF